MKIAIANDHGGQPLKPHIIQELTQQGHQLINLGTDTHDSVDYPSYATAVTEAILQGQADAGLLICGTGVGMSIAANRKSGIRAALCYDLFTAQASRDHNDANILVLGARVTDPALATQITKIFFSTPFSQEPRHIRRISLI